MSPPDRVDHPLGGSSSPTPGPEPWLRPTVGYEANRGQRSTSLPCRTASIVSPFSSSVEAPWPLRYQSPGSPVSGFGKNNPCPIPRADTEPSGCARSCDEPVPMTVVDTPDRRLVIVIRFPGNVTICLNGSPE